MDNATIKIAQKSYEWGDIFLEEIEKWVAQADQFFEAAEAKSSLNLDSAQDLFAQGVNCLLKAFLMFNNQVAEGELATLFAQCFKINSEFEAVRDELELLATLNPGYTDNELVIDAANEIWDFVIELLPDCK